IARLEANGSVDPSFDPGRSPNTIAYALALQPNGKVLVGGSFTNVNRISRNQIVRLNADGSVDANFDSGSALSSPNSATVYSIALQTNGQLVVGGSFGGINPGSHTGIARLNSDGSLDNGYAPALSLFSIVYAAALQPDQKAVIGGTFATVNGTPRNRIARLNTNGTLD